MSPWIIAHRGARRIAPENTLAAFRAAATAGANAIELDIQQSRDGHLIVMHDETVDRTSNSSGAVASLTLDEIRRLDAGSWFSSEFTGERIPTLHEVLELPLLPVIELKHGSSRFPGIERQLVSELRIRNRTDAIIISGSDEPLLELARFAPELRSLSFASNTLGSRTNHPARQQGAFSVAFAPPNTEAASEIRKSKERGEIVLGTTLWVQEPWESYLKAQWQAGLDGVFTDEPRELAEWGRSIWNGTER